MIKGRPHRTPDHNPYAPPMAPVMDVPTLAARDPRPVQVSWAVRLFWVDLTLSVVQAGVGSIRDDDAFLNLVTGVASCIFFAVEILVIRKIAAGRNWARWVAMVSFSGGVLLSIRTLRQTPSLDLVLDGTAIAADLVALYLVFLSPGRRWFSAQVQN